MQLNGEFEVSAPVKEVYSFMSNIERITTIIPDVLSLEKVNENSVRLVARAGTSFIKGRFNLTLEIKDRKVNESVRISARGSGSGGSLNLDATYSLRLTDGGNTAVRWVVDITLGGMVASMGSRVITGVSEKYIKTLTNNFKQTFESAANTDTKSEVCAVILAAGFSTRFGSNKLIMDVGGKPIISHAVESALGSSADRVAVVIPVGSPMRAYIPASVTLIINTVRDKGISSSIAAAVEYLKETAQAIMFMVADQPMIDTGTLDNILTTFRQNPSFIVASSVHGDVRNPMIFPKRYFEELLQLTGDSGAKSVAQANMTSVIKVEINPEKLVDIDTVEDLAKLNSTIKK